VVIRTAKSAVKSSAAQPRSTWNRLGNGVRGRFVVWTFRRIRAARSDPGGVERVERKSEIASSNSMAARRHSPQRARWASNRARSEASSSPSCRRERKSTDRAG